MYLDTDFPPGADRLAQFMRVVSDFERDEIEAAVDGFIAMLDAIDGDVDGEDDERSAAIMGELARDRDFTADPLTEEDTAEFNGDELDGDAAAEDEFTIHGRDGPGCPIADPDVAIDDERSDPTWTEWHGRGRHTVDGYGAEILGAHESDDAEDCDPGEDDGDKEDHNGSEYDFMAHQANGPGCPIADSPEAAGAEDDGNESEDDFMVHAGNGPGCSLADPGGALLAAYE